MWVPTVCLYAKISLKSLQKYSADDINRRHFEMQVFLVFQGLEIQKKVKVVEYTVKPQ